MDLTGLSHFFGHDVDKYSVLELCRPCFCGGVVLCSKQNVDRHNEGRCVVVVPKHFKF